MKLTTQKAEMLHAFEQIKKDLHMAVMMLL